METENRKNKTESPLTKITTRTKQGEFCFVKAILNDKEVFSRLINFKLHKRQNNPFG